jgi:hypothetical protein
LHPIASIQEEKGLSLVIRREVAEDAQIPCEILLRKISLKVHSSLEAVGLTAAISQRLAEENISANVVAGHFHDHVFVPTLDAEKALLVLKSLS